MSAASSGVARGIIPGSLKVVRSKVAITKKKMNPSATGIAGDTFTARYGQLKACKVLLKLQQSEICVLKQCKIYVHVLHKHLEANSINYKIQQ